MSSDLYVAYGDASVNGTANGFPDDLDDTSVSIGWVVKKWVGPSDEQLVTWGFRMLHPTVERNFARYVDLAEYRALVSAIRATTEYGEESIIVRGDNQTVMNHISERRPLRTDDDKGLHHALWSFLGRFDHHHVAEIHRDENPAHELSQLGHRFTEDSELMDVLSD